MNINRDEVSLLTNVSPYLRPNSSHLTDRACQPVQKTRKARATYSKMSNGDEKVLNGLDTAIAAAGF
jgi:hypothetical protein